MSTQTQTPKIILDTDPGGDDAFAFLWLASLVKQGFAEWVAVTSVEGNVAGNLTFRNACRILQAIGFENLEVGRSVIQNQTDLGNAASIHGNDGLGNLSQTLPQSNLQYETARFSDEILIGKIQENPGEITIVALAPLTNLAAAENKFPGILKLAKEIVIMGGAFNVPGNVTSEAEFNIAYHPEAAETVFNACNNLIILPLDVTRSLIFTPNMAVQISQVNPQSQLSEFLVNLCNAMTQTSLSHRETQGIEGFLVHDAVTLAYLFYPDVLRFHRGKVRIETTGTWTRGKTVLDQRNRTQIEANAWIAMQVESASFFAALLEDLKILVNG